MDLRDRFTEMREMDLQVQSTYGPVQPYRLTTEHTVKNHSLTPTHGKPFYNILLKRFSNIVGGREVSMSASGKRLAVSCNGSMFYRVESV